MLVGEVIKISIKFILKCRLFSMFSHLFFCRFQEGSIRLNVLSYSKVNIICPTKYVALKETDSDPTENQLYENVWMVDSLSYHSCNINTSIASNKKLLNCDQPSKLHWTKLLFLPLTPSGDAGYNPGETYYYICEYWTYIITCMGCSHERRRILEGRTTFRWVCMQKFWSVWCLN